MIHKNKKIFTDINVETNYSKFETESGAKEFHFALTVKNNVSYEEQIKNIHEAYFSLLEELNIDKSTAIIKRIFTSDFINQKEIIERYLDDSCANSIIEQSPLSGGKVSIWAYHIIDDNVKTKKIKIGNDLFVLRNNRKHIWTTSLINTEHESSYKQTDAIFCKYNTLLNENNLTLKDDVIRTWIYVQNVDSNYSGVVDSRRELFIEHGLTKNTNYISSTGIEGRFNDPRVKVTMDSYAVSGVKKENIKFLSALEYLNPTHEYGVTFERATSVDYGDRRHIFISGTASIDKKGDVIHLGNVYSQMKRAIDNIEALLNDANANLDNLSHIIIYLRDLTEKEIVENYIKERFPQLPYNLVLAPVCRPAWLIEIEGIATKEICKTELAAY